MSDIADLRRAVDMAFHPSNFQRGNDIERELDDGIAGLMGEIHDHLG